MNDAELLRQYAKDHSAVAFGQLVGRYLNLVYSAALRQTSGDAHLAEDVTQTVFADLSRKAASLTNRTELSGWLYTSTHHAAANMIRREARRRARELEAYLMQEQTAHSDPALDWEPLQPALDQAMHELNERDREAVLLRYFQRLAYSDVGEKLGLGENAARMRVERALEKLRLILGRRGIITTGTSLAVVLAERAVAEAPVEMAAAILRRPRVTVPVTVGIIALILQLLKMAVSKAGLAVLVTGAGLVFLETHPWSAQSPPSGQLPAQITPSQNAPPPPALTEGVSRISASRVLSPITNQYEIEGNMLLRTFRPDGSVSWEDSGKFKIFVRDAAWLVQSYEKSDLGTRLLREVGSTNGTEIFELVTDLDSATKSEQAAKVPARATISRRAVPVGRSESSFTGPLWLMFASGDYFRAGTNRSLPPVYDWQVSERGPTAAVQAEWLLLNGPGSLPARVVYKTSTGSVVASYQATGATNVGNLVLPTGFTSTRERRGSLPAMSGEATVTVVRPTCSKTNLLPVLAGKVTTRDFRVTSAGEGVSYMSDHWTSAREVEQTFPAAQPPEPPPPIVVTVPVAAIFPVRSLPETNRPTNSSSAPFRQAVLTANPALKLPSPEPWTISTTDLPEPMTLIFAPVESSRGRGQRRGAIRSFLWDHLSGETQKELTNKYTEMHRSRNQSYEPGPELAALVKNLNQIIEGNVIYDDDAFREVDLSGDTVQLLAQKPSGTERTRLNRLLLEDALSLGLLRRPKIIADPASKLCAYVEFQRSKIPNFTSALITLYDENGAKLWTADLDPQIQEISKTFKSTRRSGAPASDLSVGIWDVQFGDTDLLVRLATQNSAGIDLKTGSVHLLSGP